MLKGCTPQITPQLQESLPGPFKGTHFKKFTLGQRTPRFGPIEVLQREDGLKLILGIDCQSDVDIEVSAVVASVGIKSISLKGQLMIRLGPLIDEMPVVGGLVAYFNDQPDLDLEFTGVGASFSAIFGAVSRLGARKSMGFAWFRGLFACFEAWKGTVADMPMIYNIIHKQIGSCINNAMVLPNCISASRRMKNGTKTSLRGLKRMEIGPKTGRRRRDSRCRWALRSRVWSRHC